MKFEVQIDELGFKGTATLDFPTREEKFKLLEELQELGYGKEDNDEQITKNKLKLANSVAEVTESRIVDLNVTHTESGTNITDKAMLDVYHEGQQVIGIISNRLLGGVQLSKPKS